MERCRNYRSGWRTQHSSIGRRDENATATSALQRALLCDGVAAAIWLHFLAPAQVAPLIAAFALIVQGVSVWKLRRAVKVGRIWPFVLGSAIGVPLGAELLRWAPAAQMRIAVGGLLIAFSLYNWFRLDSTVATRTGAMVDGTVGVVNGVVGGATGLAGIAVVCGAICAAGLRPSSAPFFSRWESRPS